VAPTQRVFAVDLRPDYTALIIVAEDLQPGPSDQASDTMLRHAEGAARAALAGRAPENLDRGMATRVPAFGAKPHRVGHPQQDPVALSHSRELHASKIAHALVIDELSEFGPS
jgi:hypothetical protein